MTYTAKAASKTASFTTDGTYIFWNRGNPVIVASSPESYAYTHGGALYQAACKIVWQAYSAA
jgi:hypothetical protein